MGERSSYRGIPENTARGTHERVFSLLEAEPGVRSVLDAPCGAGAFTLRLLESGREVHSGDIEPGLKVENPRFARLDLDARLPFGDGFFDAVVSIDGIEHLERPFDFVREVRRVLRPGGVLLVSTPNLTSLRSRWRFLWTGHHNKGKTPLDEGRPSGLHHINLVSFPDLRYMLHSSGFVVEAVTANRVKPVSWLYALLAPFAYLATAAAYARNERDPGQRRRNREVLRQVFTPSLLFGETMIVKARRVADPAERVRPAAATRA
jgi:2-polyprenyl-3-methyl-5-hydroxy-6-metoxy-1,4-benzoquinol methylase